VQWSEHLDDEIYEFINEVTMEVVSHDRDSFWVSQEDVDRQEWLSHLLLTKPSAEATLSKQGAIEA
jgi:hypothetical protein